jgi:hypothetical protein
VGVGVGKTTAKKEWASSNTTVYSLKVSYAAAFFIGIIGRFRELQEREGYRGWKDKFIWDGGGELLYLREKGKFRGYRGVRGFAKVLAVLCVQCTTHCYATLIFIPLYSTTNTSIF